MRVPASGGVPSVVTALDESRSESRDVLPALAPGWAPFPVRADLEYCVEQRDFYRLDRFHSRPTEFQTAGPDSLRSGLRSFRRSAPREAVVSSRPRSHDAGLRSKPARADR